MTSNVALKSEPCHIVACTIARDIQNFELLIDDMEAELGELWGDLSFETASAFLSQPEATSLEFVVFAVNKDDEDNASEIGDMIATIKRTGVRVILVSEGIARGPKRTLLQLRADAFIPYPMTEGALNNAISQFRPAPESADGPKANRPGAGKAGAREGVIFPVHGLAGGTGASTFAVNLAWELALLGEADNSSVCLLDLDLQFGSVSTYLDLQRREAVYEMLSDIENADDEAFRATLHCFKDRLHVLTAPADILPLDILGPDEIKKMIDMARRNFDFVVIDMPGTLVQWTESVLAMAHVYFAPLEIDLRSAQNALRLIRALKAEDLPYEKLRYILNRAPKFTDLSGKSRARRMAESLDISIDLNMPDGGQAVVQACDHGQPLADTARKNPLRKEIAKLAKSLYDINAASANAA